MSFRYDFADTPFGDALLVFSDDGLVSFDLPEGMHRDSPWALEAVSRMLHALPEPDPGPAPRSTSCCAPTSTASPCASMRS